VKQFEVATAGIVHDLGILRNRLAIVQKHHVIPESLLDYRVIVICSGKAIRQARVGVERVAAAAAAAAEQRQARANASAAAAEIAPNVRTKQRSATLQ